MPNTLTRQHFNSVGLWLLLSIFLVTLMIVLGGATRLTNSGLSITEWKPITGAIPPLSHEAWQIEFDKYKQIPEFTAEHPDMDLKAFEFIYFMEWSHRQLGRLIGLAFALPYFVFLLRGKLLPHQKRRGLAILLLIGVQGAIGWWMVASGLTDGRVDVSQYRLATHLGLAFIILGLMFWTWYDDGEGRPLSSQNILMKNRSGILLVAVFVQIVAGAFVAGTHSGKSYNTWPMMDGDFVPAGYGVMSPFWRNMFENTAAIQFNHRFLAYIILALAVWMVVEAYRRAYFKRAITVLFGLVIWQVVLGIWTLLAGAQLELSLLHQFSSILVFLSTLWVFLSIRKVQHKRPPE